MANGSLRSERGVAIGLIIALIVAIGLAIWSWSNAAHARTCLNTLQNDIMTYNNQWQASKASGSPDGGICRQLNTFITSYNARCGKDYGALSLEHCG